MFLNGTHVRVDGFHSLSPRRKKKMAEGFRLALVLRQQHEDLLVPNNQLLQLFPLALDTVEVGTECAAIRRVVLELASELRIFRDAPKPGAHIGARLVLAVLGEPAVRLDRVSVVTT